MSDTRHSYALTVWGVPITCDSAEAAMALIRAATNRDAPAATDLGSEVVAEAARRVAGANGNAGSKEANSTKRYLAGIDRLIEAGTLSNFDLMRACSMARNGRLTGFSNLLRGAGRDVRPIIRRQEAFATQRQPDGAVHWIVVDRKKALTLRSAVATRLLNLRGD